jgi:hypothetical protein
MALAGIAVILATNHAYTSGWLVMRFIVLFTAGIAVGVLSVTDLSSARR